MKRKILTLLSIAFVAYSNTVYPQNVTPVAPGDFTLSDAIKAAASGDTLVLENGGKYGEYDMLVIDKKLSIRSATKPKLPGLNNLPKIVNNPDFDPIPVLFSLRNGADLTFIGVEIDNNLGKDVMKTIDTMDGDFIIKIDRCRIHNTISGAAATGEIGMILTYPSDLNVVTNGKKQNLKSFTLTNSILYNLGSRGVYFKNYTGESTILVENNTFYNIGQQMLYSKWFGGDDPSKVSITFNHNTCYNLSDPLNGKPKEILGNAGGPVTMTIKNNIFSKQNTTNASALVTTATAGSTVININNNIFKDIQAVTLDAVNIKGSNNDSLSDPQFLKADTGNFTIGNSAILTAADDGKTIGALYWDPAYSEGPIVYINNTIEASGSILSAYPNPLNDKTTIMVHLKQVSDINLSIINTSGQIIDKLACGRLNSGAYYFNYNANRLMSGVYVCRLNYGSNVDFIKLIVVR
jgi:hypothetical protein